MKELNLFLCNYQSIGPNVYVETLSIGDVAWKYFDPSSAASEYFVNDVVIEWKKLMIFVNHLQTGIAICRPGFE